MQAVKAWAAFCAMAYIVFKVAIRSGPQTTVIENIGTFVDLLGAVAILLGLIALGDWIWRYLGKQKREAPSDGATMTKNEGIPWWHVLAAVIAAVVLLAAWMFRYEPIGPGGWTHRTRITGATCRFNQECWFSSTQ